VRPFEKKPFRVRAKCAFSKLTSTNFSKSFTRSSMWCLPTNLLSLCFCLFWSLLLGVRHCTMSDLFLRRGFFFRRLLFLWTPWTTQWLCTMLYAPSETSQFSMEPMQSFVGRRGCSYHSEWGCFLQLSQGMLQRQLTCAALIRLCRFSKIFGSEVTKRFDARSLLGA